MISKLEQKWAGWVRFHKLDERITWIKTLFIWVWASQGPFDLYYTASRRTNTRNSANSHNWFSLLTETVINHNHSRLLATWPINRKMHCCFCLVHEVKSAPRLLCRKFIASIINGKNLHEFYQHQHHLRFIPTSWKVIITSFFLIFSFSSCLSLESSPYEGQRSTPQYNELAWVSERIKNNPSFLT